MRYRRRNYHQASPDAFNILSVSSINFLSGSTVLGMSCYSMIKNTMSGEMLVDSEIGTPLAVGAALGGVFGKWLFQSVSETFANKDMVGAVQASCLLVITADACLYHKKRSNSYP